MSNLVDCRGSIRATIKLHTRGFGSSTTPLKSQFIIQFHCISNRAKAMFIQLERICVRTLVREAIADVQVFCLSYRASKLTTTTTSMTIYSHAEYGLNCGCCTLFSLALSTASGVAVFKLYACPMAAIQSTNTRAPLKPSPFSFAW